MNKSKKKCRACPYSRQFAHCGKCDHCKKCFHGIEAWMLDKVEKRLGTDLFLEFLEYLNFK